MYATAILMLLLAVCLIVSKTKDYKGLSPFDKTTNLPLRGFLALLIVSHHLGQKTDIYALSHFTSGIGFQIVAIFFFISGYGLSVSYLAKERQYLNGFLYKRMGKLLPKFVMLTIGMILFYFFIDSIDFAVQATKMSFGWTPLPNSWFIYAIIYVYLAFYLCATVAKSPKQIGLLFTLSILVYILIVSKVFNFPQYWYLTIISVNLGYFVALYENRLEKLFKHRFVFYSALAGLLFVSFCAMVKIKISFLTFGLIETWILAVAFAVYAIIRTLGFVKWKWLCEVGVFSLEIYLIHGLPLMLGQRIGLDNWSLWIFTYALSIPAAILLNRGYDLLFSRSKLLRTGI